MLIAVQVVLGIALSSAKLRHFTKLEGWAKAQAISGLVFAFFILQHLFSLAMTRLYFDIETDFYWPGSVMSGPPFTYYFTAYYFLGLFAIFVHAGAAVRFGLIRSRNRRWAEPAAVAITATGAVTAGVIVLMLLGSFYLIDLPDEWVAYLQWYYPAFEPPSATGR
ncbi:MAG: hypothetical protein U0975_13295 [Erythrobacter sp.]|nr:hypothetical protein [Erythrobacter sp.]MDZ4134221.1 hypothetical protein [Paracoccaceae bacterium]MDZ4273634.1 hypothetical protein [Erythrobacter sp.]